MSPPPVRSEMNASSRPSGEYSGRDSVASCETSSRASPPSAGDRPDVAAGDERDLRPVRRDRRLAERRQRCVTAAPRCPLSGATSAIATASTPHSTTPGLLKFILSLQCRAFYLKRFLSCEVSRIRKVMSASAGWDHTRRSPRELRRCTESRSAVGGAARHGSSASVQAAGDV